MFLGFICYGYIILYKFVKVLGYKLKLLFNSMSIYLKFI